MKKLSCKCRGYFDPKDTWFILPLFMIAKDDGEISIAIGWLFLAFMIEINKDDE